MGAFSQVGIASHGASGRSWIRALRGRNHFQTISVVMVSGGSSVLFGVSVLAAWKTHKGCGSGTSRQKGIGTIAAEQSACTQIGSCGEIMVDENELVVVYSTNPIEAGFLKGLLEDSGVTVFLKDEFMGSIAPWYAAPGGVGAVKVVVPPRNGVWFFRKARGGATSKPLCITEAIP